MSIVFSLIRGLMLLAGTRIYSIGLPNSESQRPGGNQSQALKDPAVTCSGCPLPPCLAGGACLLGLHLGAGVTVSFSSPSFSCSWPSFLASSFLTCCSDCSALAISMFSLDCTERGAMSGHPMQLETPEPGVWLPQFRKVWSQVGKFTPLHGLPCPTKRGFLAPRVPLWAPVMKDPYHPFYRWEHQSRQRG